MVMRKTIVTLAVILIISFADVRCMAQQREEIEVPQVAYSEDDPHVFYVGDEAEIALSAQEIERIGGVDHLHVRLFMGTRSELLRLYRYLKDGCLVYRSQTVAVRKTSRGFMLQQAKGVPVVLNNQWLSRKPLSRG